jgi:hypothetical protein
MNELELAIAKMLSEGLARIDSLTDEEIERLYIS